MATENGYGWVPEDTLANRLVLVRRQLGITQRAAAETCGLTFGEWQGLEDGRQVRGLDLKVTAISNALGVDRDWLIWGGPMTGEGDPPRDLPSVTGAGLRGGSGRRPDQGNAHIREYRARHAPFAYQTRSVTTQDDWRIRGERGSHVLPILLMERSRTGRRCHRVAA